MVARPLFATQIKSIFFFKSLNALMQRWGLNHCSKRVHPANGTWRPPLQHERPSILHRPHTETTLGARGPVLETLQQDDGGVSLESWDLEGGLGFPGSQLTGVSESDAESDAAMTGQRIDLKDLGSS